MPPDPYTNPKKIYNINYMKYNINIKYENVQNNHASSPICC